MKSITTTKPLGRRGSPEAISQAAAANAARAAAENERSAWPPAKWRGLIATVQEEDAEDRRREPEIRQAMREVALQARDDEPHAIARLAFLNGQLLAIRTNADIREAQTFAANEGLTAAVAREAEEAEAARVAQAMADAQAVAASSKVATTRMREVVAALDQGDADIAKLAASDPHTAAILRRRRPVAIVAALQAAGMNMHLELPHVARDRRVGLDIHDDAILAAALNGKAPPTTATYGLGEEGA